jgi:hypothetical protein
MPVNQQVAGKERSKESASAGSISLADKDYLPLSSTGKVDPSASVGWLVADWLGDGAE